MSPLRSRRCSSGPLQISTPLNKHPVLGPFDCCQHGVVLPLAGGWVETVTGYRKLGRSTGGSKDPCSSMFRGMSRLCQGSRLGVVEGIPRPVYLRWQRYRHNWSMVCPPSRPRRSTRDLTLMPDDQGGGNSPHRLPYLSHTRRSFAF